MTVTMSQGLMAAITFALINSAIFIGFDLTFIARLPIAILLNGAGAIIISVFIRTGFPLRQKSKYFLFSYGLLICWCLVTIIRSFRLPSDQIITLFGHYLMAWAWLVPLAACFGPSPRCWRILIRYLKTVLIVAIPLTPIAFFVFDDSKIWAGLLEISVLCIPYLLFSRITQRRNLVVKILMIGNFLALSFLNSQRANFIFLIVVLFFMFFEWSRNSSVPAGRKILLVLGLLIVTTLVAQLNFANLMKVSRLDNMTVDTRTFLFVELADDLSDRNRIYGRGVLGTYYSPYFSYAEAHGLEGDSSTRSVVEVGYLHMILKGGAIMVVLYLIVLVPAAYLGIFRSNNSIAKGGGYLIAAYLVMWTISYYSVFNAENIILWMAVGACMSPRFRALRDSEFI